MTHDTHNPEAGILKPSICADGGESDYEDDGETASANTAKDHEQYHGRGYQQGTSTQEHDPNGVLSASQTRHADQQQQKGTLPENIWANQPAVVTDAVSPVNEAEQESCSTEQQHFRRYRALRGRYEQFSSLHWTASMLLHHLCYRNHPVEAKHAM